MISGKIAVVEGDITRQLVDAIVNAANTSLLGGGGVDGAIHRAAGSGLLEECRRLNGCKTGDAKITKGYNLPTKWVIHTVGPIWQDGNRGEDELLASCYRRCLELAEQNEIRTIAFPAISTGAFSFPLERATRIAVTQVKNFLEIHTSVEQFRRQKYEGRGLLCSHVLKLGIELLTPWSVATRASRNKYFFKLGFIPITKVFLPFCLLHKSLLPFFVRFAISYATLKVKKRRHKARTWKLLN